MNPRRAFLLPVVVSFLSLPFSLYKWSSTSLRLTSLGSVLLNPWLGSSVAVLPLVIMLAAIARGHIRSTAAPFHPILAPLAVFAPAFTFLSVEHHRTERAPVSGADSQQALWLSVFCAVTFVLYDTWYTRLPENQGAASVLQVGKMLPSFTLPNECGVLKTSTEVISEGSDSAEFVLFMFVRGSWCPLCTAQVRGMAKRWRDLHDLGMRVVVVTAERPRQLKQLASKFEVPFTFLCDRDCSVAKQLGITHVDGMPLPLRWEADTILPTTVIVDSSGHIRHVTTTNDYRVRVDAEELITAARRMKEEPR